MADRLRSGRALEIDIPVPDGDERARALVADPAGYFDRARASAYEHAAAELDEELTQDSR